MSSTTPYTELETLLLFQALRAEGVSGITPTTFNRISDQLNKVSLICDDPAYDGGRLSPDALRERYLDLLKEEAKQEVERKAKGNNYLANGSVSSGSRKRKASSPGFPSVREAQQHSHLIPQLVSRLYGLYRDATIKKLHVHETNFAAVKQQIAEGDRVGHDDEVSQPSHQSRQVSPRPSSTAHTQLNLSVHDDQSAAATAASPLSSRPADESNTSQAPPKHLPQAKIDAVINHGPEPRNSPDGHRRVSSNTTLPPLSEMAPQSPRLGIPPNVAPAVTQSAQALHPGYIHSPPTAAAHQSPYASQHAPARSGSVPSPQVQQSISRPSSSPRPLLPPPKGMQLPASGHGSHVGSPVSHATPPPFPSQPFPHGSHPPPYQPQPRTSSSGPSTAIEGAPRAYPVPSLAPQPTGYYQQQSPYVDRRISYPTQHAQPGSSYPGQPPQPPGYLLSPYPMQSQEPPRPLPQQHGRPHHTPIVPQKAYPYDSLPYNGPATGPRNILPQPSRLVSDVVAALATPPRPKLMPLWKREYPAHIPLTPRPRPEIEPLSPTLEPAKSAVRSTRSTRGQHISAVEDQVPAERATKGRSSKRKTNARDRSPHSVVSSTADESLRTYTRSQSVSTAVGTNQLSDDRPNSRNGVKPEPSTPAETLEEGNATALTPATSTSGMMTRKRRGTIQTQPQPPTKRKRQTSPGTSAEDVDPVPTSPLRPNTVLATRNFAKMSSVIMNDITSHKHASYFAKEVRDRDAPGYTDIVRQPQNLKAIRSAITAGARAIAAASSNADSPPGANSSTATTVELERTLDLISPKAIVNGAQLEKELMRMFANAYMFNPGEDGMALSTKEMFEDVERKIREWRGTERDAGRDPAAEDEEEGKAKRRKL